GDNDQRTPNFARVYVKLDDPKKRALDQMGYMAKVREEIVAKQPKELRIQVQLVAAISGGGNASSTIQYVMSGPDLERLNTYAQQAVEILKKVPGAVDVDSSLVNGKPEVTVNVD